MTVRPTAIVFGLPVDAGIGVSDIEALGWPSSKAGLPKLARSGRVGAPSPHDGPWRQPHHDSWLKGADFRQHLRYQDHATATTAKVGAPPTPPGKSQRKMTQAVSRSAPQDVWVPELPEPVGVAVNPAAFGDPSARTRPKWPAKTQTRAPVSIRPAVRSGRRQIRGHFLFELLRPYRAGLVVPVLIARWWEEMQPCRAVGRSSWFSTTCW